MAGMDSRTDPGVPDSVRKMEKVNQKSLPERTADAVMSMLHHENYGVGQKLPNEIKQSKWVIEERNKILVDAQKEADEMLKEAEVRLRGRARSYPAAWGSMRIPWDFP